MTKQRSLLPCVVLLSLLGNSLFAQGLSTARALGLARSYTAVARGVEAAWWNPANLGFKDAPAVSIRIAGGGVGAENNSFTVDDLITKFEDEILTQAEQRELVDKVPGEGLTGSAQAEATAIGLSIRHWALTLTAQSTAEATLPRDYFELLLFDGRSNRSFVLDGLRGQGAVIGEVGLSYGTHFYLPIFSEFTIGATAKYLRGLVFGQILETTGTLSVNNLIPSGQGRGRARAAEGGDGFGLDLGAAARWGSSITLGVSAVNVVGKVTWDTEAEDREIAFRIARLDTLRADPDELEFSDVTAQVQEFDQDLPSLLRAGLAIQGRHLLLALHYEQGLEEEVGLTSDPRLSGGLELRLIPFLPLRGGVSVGGQEDSFVSLGLGLDLKYFTLDVAGVSNEKAFFTTSAKGGAVAVSLGLQF